MVPRALPARTVRSLLFVALLVAPAPACAQTGEPCDGTFTLESPDTLGAVGEQSAIAVDARGRARIAYRNAAGTQIRYAEQEDAGWNVELVPQRGLMHGLSLALDPDGVPVIGYGAQEDTPVGTVISAKVATQVQGIWTTERIENAIPGEVAVAFDPAGVLHAVYFSFIPAFVIRYATRGPDGWTPETAFSTGGLGAGRFSLAFDPQGRAHVTAQVSQVLIHLVRTDTGWAVDRQPFGEGAVLAVDAAGVPHVATHLRDPLAVVQYRTRSNGVWSTEVVDTADAGPARGIGLAIDRSGRPVVAYGDLNAGTLKVAWKEGGVWKRRAVDAGGAGEGPALALADGARPRISSMDPASFDLRFVAVELPPPNHAPVADAGGPYEATVLQPIAFDAARARDPDGDALSYAWDLGDGAHAVGPAPVHAYAAAGSYRACLAVADRGCPALGDSACAAVTVREALAARVFRPEDRKIELSGLGGTGPGAVERFQLEPVGGDFPLSDLDLSTVEASYGAARVPAAPDRAPRLHDTDGNGVPDLAVSFTIPELRALFAAAPPGKSRVTMTLTGALRSGARLRGEVTCELQNHRDCRDGCAEVRPNPLNPDAVIRFTLERPGSVEIELFDAQGRSVGMPLPRAFLAAGPHERRIDGGPLASGVYFYRIRTADGNVDGRFAVLK